MVKQLSVPRWQAGPSFTTSITRLSMSQSAVIDTYMLKVARRFALQPQFSARARPEAGQPALHAYFQALPVHVCHGEHLFRIGVLYHGRDQPVLIEYQLININKLHNNLARRRANILFYDSCGNMPQILTALRALPPPLKSALSRLCLSRRSGIPRRQAPRRPAARFRTAPRSPACCPRRRWQ